MSAAIYREFRVIGPSVWKALAAFVGGNAKAQIEKGQPLRIIVTSEEQKRNAEQNKFYWAAVIDTIVEMAWVDGQQFGKLAWHEHFARLYGVCEEITLPTGEIFVRRKSTTEMTVSEFSAYIEKVQAAAASDLGVEFR